MFKTNRTKVSADDRDETMRPTIVAKTNERVRENKLLADQDNDDVLEPSTINSKGPNSNSAALHSLPPNTWLERINNLECELMPLPINSQLWHINETHELLLPRLVSTVTANNQLQLNKIK